MKKPMIIVSILRLVNRLGFINLPFMAGFFMYATDVKRSELKLWLGSSWKSDRSIASSDALSRKVIRGSLVFG
jgi:hypothetical protein